jgi:RimJ/RimL family protein N-acetyltransferase
MFQIEDGLVFRKVCDSDLQDLFVLKQESWDMTHNVSFLNIHDQQQFLQKFQSNITQPKDLLLIACLNSFVPIGMFFVTGIDYVSRSADIAWGIYKKHRGVGYGKNLAVGGTSICFNILNLNRLNCEILSNNQKSLKCALHAGYTIEGTKRQAVFKQGKYLDSQVLGILRSDFDPKPIEGISCTA